MPLLTYEWEPLSILLDDGLAELVRQHWEEVGVHKDEMPLACNWDRYQNLEDQDILKILAVRADGDFIGYNSFLYLPNLHYDTTDFANGDAIYVLRARRSSGAGLALIDRAERHIAELANGRWCRIIYHDRHGVELLGPVLRRRGYVATDTVYSKMVRA